MGDTQEISLDLALKLNLTIKEHSSLTKEKQYCFLRVEKLMSLSILHFEWSRIREIDNLELFAGIKTLYLQHVSTTQNQIAEIQNLEFLVQLEYLSVAGNEISRIRGLRTLRNLLYLDLSTNLIQELEVEEIPGSVALLKVRENPFCDVPDYQKTLVLGLPDLEELDGQEITVVTRFEAKGLP